MPARTIATWQSIGGVRTRQVPPRPELEGRSRDDSTVRAAAWADAARSLAIAQAGYRAALEGGAGSAALVEATAALMRARTRLEALRRAAATGELLAAG